MAATPATPAPPAPVPQSVERRDFWASLPASALGYAHALGEAALPVFPQYARYATAVTLTYVAMSSVDRGNKAAKLEPFPELRRYNGFAAAFESAFGGWVALITLPSMALGLVTGPLAALAQAQAARLPSGAVRYGPAAASALLLPLLLPACAAGSEWALAFAVRPTIDSNRPVVVSGPQPDYDASSGDELLLGLGALPDLDAADRARLRWALDGDAASPYPDEAAPGGGSAGGRPPSSAAAAAAAPPPASSSEDAAFLASLHDYAARRRRPAVATAAAAAAAGGAGGAPAASPLPQQPDENDFDRMVAAAVDSATGGRLSRALSAAEGARAAAGEEAAAGSRAPLR